jgi:hypothetical protein
MVNPSLLIDHRPTSTNSSLLSLSALLVEALKCSATAHWPVFWVNSGKKCAARKGQPRALQEGVPETQNTPGFVLGRNS